MDGREKSLLFHSSKKERGGKLMNNSKKIFILVGASGSGKTTLGGFLKDMGIPELVSHTTRPMRDGEVEGVSYYFVSKGEFDKTDKIEYSEYAGNYYCLSKKETMDKLSKNKAVFAITDINGMTQIKEKYPNFVVPIYISIEKTETIEERMSKRGDKAENIKKRIQNAIENDEFSNYKYCKYIIDNNGDLENAVTQLIKIVEDELTL